MQDRAFSPFRSNAIAAFFPFAIALTLTLPAPAALSQNLDTVVASPHARRGANGASTLFTKIAAEETGVSTLNAYDDPRMWRQRYHEYGVGAIGSGIAIGDFDGDGLPDLYVASKLESPRLFRNLGDWKFEDVTEAAGVGDDSGEWKQGVASIDIDNDGDLDLYLCRLKASNLLFINRGDGVFTEEAAARGLDVADGSGMAAFQDYDRDGDLDLYLQTNLADAAAMPDGQPDRLFRNTGNGRFVDVSTAAGIRATPTQGHSATWWDYNEDGWPDLYVANDFALPDFLYANNGDGTFTEEIGKVVPTMPFSSMGADLGDVNNDGHMDLLVADMANTTHEKDQRGTADSRFNLKETTPGSPNEAIQLPRSMLFLNTGLGRCLEAARYAGVEATNWTWSVLFDDLDNDGYVDLHVTNGMNREQNNVDIIETMLSSTNASARIRAMYTAPVLNEANLAFRNLGDGRFEPTGPQWGLDDYGVSFGAALGDLDNDGDLDLAYVNYQRSVTLFRNDSTKGNAITLSLRGTESNALGIGATVRIETDRYGTLTRVLTPARGYMSTNQPILHFGLGELASVERATIQWPSGIVQVVEDLEAGHHYTIMETQTARAPSRSVRARRPQFTLSDSIPAIPEERIEGTVDQPLLGMRFNRRGPAAAVADLDGNGIQDLALGGTTLRALRLYGGLPNELQTLPLQDSLSPAAVNDGPLLVFDANADGLNDLLIAAGGAVFHAEEPEYEPRLLLKKSPTDGYARAPASWLPSAPNSAGAAAAADFDRDGDLDVFIGGRVAPGFYPEIPYSALFAGSAEGPFTDATDELSSGLRDVGMVTSAIWTDIDGDGWQDLLVALDWGGIRVFRNQDGESFTDQSEALGFSRAGTGWWTSLASGDLNADGLPDIVAGNVGLNTQFDASPERPEILFYHDFSGAGPPQLVRAYYEGERLLPRHSRRELAAKIPSVLKKYPKNNDFAKASLDEILDPKDLNEALRLEVTELRSGVFLSQPDGAYRFAALPGVAQLAPLQGIALRDFNGDGHLDIAASQNSYAPRPYVGRFDGGLGVLLLGDGEGGFSPLSAASSGILIPGDAKALAVLDVDDDAWPDLLATRNNAASLLFKNAGNSQRRPMAVTLDGLPGNLSAIGSRLVLTLADGSTQVRAVQAGSGWATQSSSTAFFSYPSDTPPRSLEIRWPDGSRTTREDLESTDPQLVIIQGIN